MVTERNSFMIALMAAKTELASLKNALIVMAELIIMKKDLLKELMLVGNLTRDGSTLAISYWSRVELKILKTVVVIIVFWKNYSVIRERPAFLLIRLIINVQTAVKMGLV